MGGGGEVDSPRTVKLEYEYIQNQISLLFKNSYSTTIYFGYQVA